jgi:ABC-type lipoprotein export system ATPase subunit
MAKTENVDMVLVMGLSGAGKSYFINTLTGAQTDSEDEVKVGKRLKSCKKRKAP